MGDTGEAFSRERERLEAFGVATQTPNYTPAPLDETCTDLISLGEGV